MKKVTNKEIKIIPRQLSLDLENNLSLDEYQTKIFLNFDIEKIMDNNIKALLEKQDAIKSLKIKLKTLTSVTAIDDQKETVTPPSDWAEWFFYFMPADKLDDGLACLEELYTTRFLPMYNGNKKKADRMFKWQVVLLVLGNNYNRLKYCLISLVGVFGFPRLLITIKNWLAF